MGGLRTCLCQGHCDLIKLNMQLIWEGVILFNLKQYHIDFYHYCRAQ